MIKGTVGLSGAKKNFLEPKTCSLDNNPVHLSDAFSTGVGLFGHSQNQLHGASYFDHYSQLRTPFSMILYSLESLWNSLQEYLGGHLIWSSFGRRNIRIPSDHPDTHRNQLHHVLIITFCPELRFWWSWTLWKAYEIVYKNVQKSISLDQVLGTDSIHQFNRCYYFMWNSTNSAFIWVLSLILVLLGLCIHPWDLIWFTR